jgi:hypothetical protein
MSSPLEPPSIAVYHPYFIFGRSRVRILVPQIAYPHQTPSNELCHIISEGTSPTDNDVNRYVIIRKLLYFKQTTRSKIGVQEIA